MHRLYKTFSQWDIIEVTNKYLFKTLFACRKGILICTDHQNSPIKKLIKRHWTSYGSMELLKICLSSENVCERDSSVWIMVRWQKGWNFLEHPPISPYRPDFHLFGALKEALVGQHFSNNNKRWKNLCLIGFRHVPTSFYDTRIKTCQSSLLKKHVP